MSAPGRRSGGVILLPSTLTVLAICAGMTAIRSAQLGQESLAIIFIVAAAALDGVDGRLARLLDASTKIGAELDSLADAVNFGVAPALLVYFTLLHNHPLGWFVVLLYVVSMVLRLARFNTLTDQVDAPAFTRDFFAGVPAPAGAVVVLAPLALQQQFGAGWWSSMPAAITWTVVVALLCVSRIPTSSFKTMVVRPVYLAPALVVVGALGALALTYPYLVLILLIGLYLLHIPFAWRSRRWVAARPEAWETKPAERREIRRVQRRSVPRGGQVRYRQSSARLGLRRPPGPETPNRD